MSYFFRILGIFTLITSLATSVIAQAASPTKDSIRQAEQNELVTKQSNGKKALKKKLALDYTNPKFSSDINQSQKDAILKSLKKWKLDLPVNNTFTVTSISDLKKNQKVVYMWAVTPNANWDNSRPYNVEDYEEGDPRFVRTEFNVLLKKSGNGWKATLEQDNELKSELPSIPESEITTEEKNVLFGANKPENIFTEKNEILIEGNSISSSSSSSTLTSSTQSVSSSVSSKTVGLLDVLFGSPTVSAGATDYSFPWTNGQQYYIGQGWHGDYTYYGRNDNGTFYGTPNGVNVSGFGLDMQPYNGASTDVLAPVSGTIQRSCVDIRQSHLKFEKMGILHIATSGITNATSVTKNQKIGNVFNPAPYFNVGQTYSGLCGTTGKTHLHISILDNQIIDGNSFSYGTNYNPVPIPGTPNANIRTFTSQNTAPVQGSQNVNLYWRNNNNTNVRWVMNNTTKIQSSNIDAVSQDWRVGAIADFNNDGNDDILWRNTNGTNVMWFLNSSGNFIGSQGAVDTVYDTNFDAVGASDFNNDGKPDILWRNKVTGQNVIWYMNGSSHISDGNIQTIEPNFEIVGTGDFNRDGKSDILWRNKVTGENVIFYMNNTLVVQGVPIGYVTTNWTIAGTVDFNGDGNPDILWRDKNNGQDMIWYMNNGIFLYSANLETIPTDWKLEVKN